MAVLSARTRWPKRPPGIAFEAVLPRVMGLPRMDVAMLVGFAESGPLDVPVAVEDTLAFADVFGRDVTLARGPGDEATVSRLGAAVRSFFAEGGRRCWAVRVAGRHAETSRFEIPGLVALAGGQPEVATAWARSPGSWADDVEVGSALTARPIRVASIRTIADEIVEVRAEVPASEAVRVGDLVRVATGGGGRVGFVAVEAAELLGRGESGQEVALTGRPLWFAPTPEVAPGEVRVGEAIAVVVAGEGPGTWELELAATALPEPGQLVRFTRDGAVFFVVVERAVRVAGVAGPSVRLRGSCHQWLGSALLDDEPLQPGAAVLTFELWARRAGRPPQRMSDLGLCPGHPRYWRRLPADQRLFLARLRGEAAASGTDLATGEAGGARFPLAGDADAAADATALYVPLAIPPAPEWFAPAQHSGADAAVRDGLDRFPLEAFLDPDLTGANEGRADTAAALRNWAEYRQFLAPDRRHLHGVFAAFSVPEVSLLAVPDALHPDFRVTEVSRPPAFEPPIHSGAGGWTLRWRSDEVAPQYVIEERGPDGASREIVTSAPRLDVPPGLEPGVHHFRVRVQLPGSPWSAPLDVTATEPRKGAVFAACSALTAAELAGDPEVAEATAFALAWPLVAEDPHGAPARYIVEEAPDPGFTRAFVLHEATAADVAGPGGSASLLVQGRRAGDQYFRLRVVRGEESVTSTGILVRIRARRRSMANLSHDGASPAALRIHEHVLRLCAARGDVLAVLALPAWYREDAALGHAGALLERFGESEPHVLTYGALHHPWLVVPDGEGGALRPVPPDGAACGAMARTALARGVWIAAANRPLGGVIGLAPALSAERLEQLATAQINVVVRDPRGFVLRSEDTLATVPELLAIHTRRLLILLRRLTLEQGAVYAFEPNGAALERMVERGFTGLLRRLFDAGAFAGDSPARAFRLRVGSGVTTPSGAPPETLAEAARFSVDIAVAPAGAIGAVTVRLVQDGARGVVVEGV